MVDIHPKLQHISPFSAKTIQPLQTLSALQRLLASFSLPQCALVCFISALKTRLFIKYWLPVLIWMVVIFSASSDKMSFQRSSRIIAPLIHWLFPQFSEKTVREIVTVVRKCAHLTEYAILALLLWRAKRKPVRNDPRPWKGSEARFAVFIVALYASTDEFHQLFVPSRQGSVWDVLLDTTGAVIGMLLLWVVGRWLKWWGPP